MNMATSERTIRNRLSHAADLIGAACVKRAQRRQVKEEAQRQIREQEMLRGTVFEIQPINETEQKQ
jgi:hypothetical protein